MNLDNMYAQIHIIYAMKLVVTMTSKLGQGECSRENGMFQRSLKMGT
jgi:hypothetical protein